MNGGNQRRLLFPLDGTIDVSIDFFSLIVESYFGQFTEWICAVSAG